MANLRSVLSWAVSEDWIADDPALNVVVRSPPKRKVMWAPEQAEACIAKAKELALHPIAIMAVVFDCIGVSTVDCYTLKHGVYDGRAIDVTRTKTGVSGAPSHCGRTSGTRWMPVSRRNPPNFRCTTVSQRPHRARMVTQHACEISCPLSGRPLGRQRTSNSRTFRRTAQTDAGAAGGTVDEIRGRPAFDTLGRRTLRSPRRSFCRFDPRKKTCAEEQKRPKSLNSSAEMSEEARELWPSG